MTRVLAVVAHPDPQSRTKAVAAHLLAGAADHGAAVEESDLYCNGFDPRLDLADIQLFRRGGGEGAPDVLAEQAKLQAADAVAFVFPVWWWSVPAYLKGYVDRVITRGFAYGHDAQGASVRGLAGKRIRLVALTASGPGTYEAEGFRQAMETQLVHGIFELYCGVEDVALASLDEATAAEPDNAAAAALFARAATIGADLAGSGSQASAAW
jgi:NAD(P)H dehydrogenase (quinone)